MGSFNLLRKLEDINKPGGDVNKMLAFNDAINALGIIEIPLLGRKYTWSNMQESPPLQKIDWFFTSATWALELPGTGVKALARDTSDHVPCLVIINTKIPPKPKIFIFENYRMEHRDFMAKVEEGWNMPVRQMDIANRITAKLKNLRKVLKDWASKLSNLSRLLTIPR